MIENLVIAAVAILVVGGAMIAGRLNSARQRANESAQRDKNEALFRAMFPELQPHFHPERVIEFVRARLARGPAPAASYWSRPPGFPAASAAECAVGEKGREHVRLAGKPRGILGEFQFEKHPEGAVLRVDKGKLTVDLRKPEDPRVRYWHPEREFKWSRAGWIFRTPVADEPFESSSSGSNSSSSDSSSGSARTAAAAAGIVGLGGAFDGGGASAGWDDAAAGSAAGSPGGALAGDAGSDSSGGTSSDSSSGSLSDSGSTAY